MANKIMVESKKAMKKELQLQELRDNINENKNTADENLDLNIRARESRDNTANTELRDSVTEKTLKASAEGLFGIRIEPEQTASARIESMNVIRPRSYSAPTEHSYEYEPIDTIHIDA